MAERQLTKEDVQAAENLKNLWYQFMHDRQKQGKPRMSQEKAGKLMDMTQGAVSQFINGTTPLSSDAILKFARLLGCSPKDIRPDFYGFQIAETMVNAASSVQEPGIRDHDSVYTVPSKINIAELAAAIKTAAQNATEQYIEKLQLNLGTADTITLYDMIYQQAKRYADRHHSAPSDDEVTEQVEFIADMLGFMNTHKQHKS